MANEQRVNELIDKVVHAMLELKQIFKQESKVVQAQPQTQPQVQAQSAPPPPRPAATQQPVLETFDDFDSLKKALESDKWPEAVNPNLICDPNSADDKIERGRGIIELMIDEDLKGLKLLDIGCGEGHCAFLSADYDTTVSVGYDLKKYDTWDALPVKSNLHFTSDFAKVEEHGPYDIIIMFDVLDHIDREDPSQLLRRAANLLSPNGKIYLRVHPYISRSGTHLYHDLNKAYVHLVFTPAELKEIVPESKYEEKSYGVLYPLKTYQTMIEKAGLKVENRRDITEKVETFFKIPKIAERIMKNTGMNTFPEFQMSLHFIDYVLRK